MENNQVEIAVLNDVVLKVSDIEIRELNDLQLALIGGGVGEVTLT